MQTITSILITAINWLLYGLVTILEYLILLVVPGVKVETAAVVAISIILIGIFLWLIRNLWAILSTLIILTIIVVALQYFGILPVIQM